MEEKPDPSNDAKIVHGSTEPLTLRPPVGSEVGGGLPSLRFRSIFHPNGQMQPRQHLLHHCLILALFLFVLLSLFLFVVFVLGVHPPDKSNYASHRDGVWSARRQTCVVFIARVPMHLVESASTQDEMINVTMSEDSGKEDDEQIRILHVCSEGLTVIRTKDRCYIRPISAERRRDACMASYIRHIQQGLGLRKEVRANRVSDELWFAEPPVTIPELIQNSHIMNFCDGVPALRLVSRPPPSGFVVDEPTPKPEDSVAALPPRFGKLNADSHNSKDDDADFMDTLYPKAVPAILRLRFRRSVPLKGDKRIDQPQSTSPVHCRNENSIFEDPVLRLDSETDEVDVTRDIILNCHKPEMSTV